MTALKSQSLCNCTALKVGSVFSLVFFLSKSRPATCRPRPKRMGMAKARWTNSPRRQETNYSHQGAKKNSITSGRQPIIIEQKKSNKVISMTAQEPRFAVKKNRQNFFACLSIIDPWTLLNYNPGFIALILSDNKDKSLWN